MIHPDSYTAHISEHIGLGVFASAFIPKGTIVYVADELETRIPHDSHLLEDEHYAALIHKFAYLSPEGFHILSWDHGRYVNHSCNANTLSTGYGFEIAIRDIHPGEEITDDYGMFNLAQQFDCFCSENNCRKSILHNDIFSHGHLWDRQVRDALGLLLHVEQPLVKFLQSDILASVKSYLKGYSPYRSVSNLCFEHSEVLSAKGI